ncbi:hypothetical protein AaE_005317 [Aphanomyces astaci]|uniref:Uncharacterized protein n=1 Tax=Aphanomyces astaci TaxID=112090 RepID=A0A6A5ANE4_APHAT|nr:hypothetical protein AaE_005317 [Aphanomyces astaci]
MNADEAGMHYDMPPNAICARWKLEDFEWRNALLSDDGGVVSAYCELVRKLEAAGDLIPESAYATKLLVLIPERFHNTVLHINRNHSTQPKYKTRDYRAASRPRTPTLPSGSRPSTSDQRCGVPGKPQKSRASTARSPVIIVVRRCRRKTGDMERGIDRKNINKYGRQQQNPTPNGYLRGGRSQI